MNENKTKVAIYVRVSSEEQAEKGFSIEEQQKLLLTYCESNQFDVFEVYVDSGLSAKDIVHRPALKKLMKDAKDRKFNLVITWKISRLSRRLKDAIEIVEFLEKYDITYKSYSEPFETNTLTGKMQFQLISMIAEFERGTIAQNVKMGQLARSKKGMWVGGPAMLGYDWCVMPEYRNVTGRRKSMLVINQKEAEVVREIYNLYCEGKGYKAIANTLNKEGHLTKKGKPFAISTIKDILLNPVYKGYVRYNVRQNWNEKRRKNINPDPVIVKGIHEAIITDEQWEKVQAIYKNRKGEKSKVFSHEFPLTGIMRCPLCGAGMVVSGTTNTLKDGTKKRIPYYSCGAFANKGSSVCHSNSINANIANKEVFKRVENFCQNRMVQEKVIKKLKEVNEKKQKEIDKEINIYNYQIESHKRRKEKIFEAFENDIITSNEFLQRKKTIDNEIAEIMERKEKRLEELAVLQSNEIPDQLILSTLKRFAEVLENCKKKELKKELMHLLIKKITLTKQTPRRIKDIYLSINENIIDFLGRDESVKDESLFFLSGEGVKIVI